MATASAPRLPGWEPFAQGKVRTLYRPTLQSEDERILLLASDRVSAFDRVLEPELPSKGALLTQVSLWWFEHLETPHHALTDQPVPQQVRQRALVCRHLDMFPIECIVRGYLAGSALREYGQHGTIGGRRTPPGLRHGDRLPEPLFTPTTKAAPGHSDQPLTDAAATALLGAEIYETLRQRSIELYRRADALARDRGIIVADTKFEFGRSSEGLIRLGDEALTPDSSRLWDGDAWERGKIFAWDKQYVRDWLSGPEAAWGRDSGIAPPPLPPEVTRELMGRYGQLYERLLGQRWSV